jgi:alcohol dehydrogenase
MLRDELRITPGYRLYIPGGAGGVGTFAIQIAKHLGAYVATTASPAGRDLVVELGADEVIDYTTTDPVNVLHGFDGALDLRGGADLLGAFAIVRNGGAVVSVAGVPEPTTARKDLGREGLLPVIFWLISANVRRKAKKAQVSYRRPFMRPDGSDLAELAILIENEVVRVILDSVYPFDSTAEAFAALERGHAKGKIVVTFS